MIFEDGSVMIIFSPRQSLKENMAALCLFMEINHFRDICVAILKQQDSYDWNLDPPIAIFSFRHWNCPALAIFLHNTMETPMLGRLSFWSNCRQF